MAYYGVLAYMVTWACKTKLSSDVTLFLAAMCVTLSAGLVSRFTGRQAMGNTVAGLYVLSPGAYLVNELIDALSLNFWGPLFSMLLLLAQER